MTGSSRKKFSKNAKLNASSSNITNQSDKMASSKCQRASKDKISHMYFIEGGILVVPELRKPEDWIHDAARTHCGICMQQFFSFRRRHHCRTCGEVVCSSCSTQRNVHLITSNIQCVTRICCYCVMKATNATIRAVENDSNQLDDPRSISTADSSWASSMQVVSPKNTHRQPSSRHSHAYSADTSTQLTDGSIVQLWPAPTLTNEKERIQIVQNILQDVKLVNGKKSPDSTMKLLMDLVAKTLDSPIVFLGLLDHDKLIMKSSVGWDKTFLPRDNCVCTETMETEKITVVPDTNVDKYFYANTLEIEGYPLRFYAGAPVRVLNQCIGAVCAVDNNPHDDLSISQRSTLQAVAKIVSEVLEQRLQIEEVSDQLESVNEFISVASSQFMASELEFKFRQSKYEMSKQALSSSPWVRQSATLMGFGQRLCSSIEQFQKLHSNDGWAPISTYSPTSQTPKIESFHISVQDQVYTKSQVTIRGDWTKSIMSLQDYDNFGLYGTLISSIGNNREIINSQTWIDSITGLSNSGDCKTQKFQVLSHWRPYPDGSNIILAVNASSVDENNAYGLLFGWLVTPCTKKDVHKHSDGLTNDPNSDAKNSSVRIQSFTVSCIVSHNFGSTTSRETNYKGNPYFAQVKATTKDDDDREKIASLSLLSSFTSIFHTPIQDIPQKVCKDQLTYEDLCSVMELNDKSDEFSLHDLEDLDGNLSEISYVSYDCDDDSQVEIEDEDHINSNNRSSECQKLVSVNSPTSKQQQIADVSQTIALHQQCQREQKSGLQVSGAAESNEIMILQLLEKTTRTQDILVKQQHTMSTVVGYHDQQLNKIWTAVERMEDTLERTRQRLLPNDFE